MAGKRGFFSSAPPGAPVARKADAPARKPPLDASATQAHSPQQPSAVGATLTRETTKTTITMLAAATPLHFGKDPGQVVLCSDMKQHLLLVHTATLRDLALSQCSSPIPFPPVYCFSPSTRDDIALQSWQLSSPCYFNSLLIVMKDESVVLATIQKKYQTEWQPSRRQHLHAPPPPQEAAPRLGVAADEFLRPGAAGRSPHVSPHRSPQLSPRPLTARGGASPGPGPRTGGGASPAIEAMGDALMSARTRIARLQGGSPGRLPPSPSVPHPQLSSTLTLCTKKHKFKEAIGTLSGQSLVVAVDDSKNFEYNLTGATICVDDKEALGLVISWPGQKERVRVIFSSKTCFDMWLTTLPVAPSESKHKKMPTNVFGAKLERAILPGTLIPFVVTSCITSLQNNGMNAVGIFRLSGSHAVIDKYVAALDKGKDVDFDKIGDPHVVAGILKKYLRDLEEPLFPFHSYDALVHLIECQQVDVRVLRLQIILEEMPPSHKVTIQFLFNFLHTLVKEEETTKMTAQNLAIVLGPNLVRPRDESNLMAVLGDIKAVNFVVEDLIVRCEQVFAG